MPDFRYKTIIPDVDFWKRMIPCQAACPVHTDAGKYVQLIAAGQYEEAYLVARSPNPLASICGRVCAAPCEDWCRRGSIDAPVSIRALKRFVTEKYGVESLLPDTQDALAAGRAERGNQRRGHLPILTASRKSVARGQRVAVIGAGPAGVSCAHDLALMGYGVTVFEASETAGGMMYHGIPEFRLPRSIIDKEIGKIKSLGVEVRLNAPLGPSFGLKQLRDEGFDSVFLSIGTQRGRDLMIEGAELDGVVKAIDFLINVNHGYRVSLGKRVLVIGGGFVAFDAARMAIRKAAETEPEQPGVVGSMAGSMVGALDAARSALRAGVADVRLVSLESFDEMPVLRSVQGKHEFDEARKEGVAFHTQRGARRILGEGGRVHSVDLIGVKRTYDDDGRFNPVYDPEFSENMKADTVILAIGQEADLSFLKPEDGVELTPARTIRVDGETLATSARGIFAGGDVAFGPRNLIQAVANGKRAALSIDDHLRGVAGKSVFNLWIDKAPTRAYRRAEDYEKLEREAAPSVSLGRRTGISEVETGYNEAQAKQQAERCLYCHVQTIYDPQKCVLCNRCVDVCPEYCLKLVPVESLDLSPDVIEQITESTGVQMGVTLSAMIKDDEKCIRCGLCAIRCPTDAMTMEVFHYEEREAV